MKKQVKKVAPKKSGGLLDLINEVLGNYHFELAMLIKHETATRQKSGGVRRSYAEPIMDFDLEPKVKTTLFVVKVDRSILVDQIEGDGRFIMPASKDVLTFSREHCKEKFSFLPKTTGSIPFPTQAVIPLEKKTPENVSGEEILDILKSRDHGMGLIGDKAVIQWFFDDYLENPSSNAPEMLAQVIKHFRLDKRVDLSGKANLEKRLSVAEERFEQVEDAIQHLVPQKLRELMNSIEHEKKQLEILVELSTERRGG